MSSNPLLNIRNTGEYTLEGEPMTISGTTNKTALLSAILAVSGFYTWNICATGFTDKANLLMIIGIIAGLILCIVTIVKPVCAKFTAPMYALCEGLVLGSISYAYGSMFDGIVQNAIIITLMAMFSMLFLYKTRILNGTPAFRKTIFVSTMAIGIFYFIGMITSLFGHPMTLFNGGLFGIGVSLVICVVAALNFVVDFDNIERYSNSFAPKYMEWYFAFSILVTLIWLYLEILRLLAQLSSRRN